MKKFILLLLVPFISISQTQIGLDIDGEGPGDQSGTSVSISADGQMVAIGALNNDGSGTDAGHVRVYENINNTWVQVGNDINGEAAEDYSGYSISLSSDGMRLAISSILVASGNDRGHVRIFENNNGAWSQLGQTIEGNMEGDFYGERLSFSANGNTLAISSTAWNNRGYVQIYTFSDPVWTQVGQNIEGENSNGFFGRGLDISANGEIVAIGDDGTDEGLVQVFENNNNTWIQIGDDILGEGSSDKFGKSVSMSANGNIVAIGAYANDGNGSNSGHVRVFENVNNNWTQIGDDINGEAEFDESGWSISLASNGSVLAIGARFNDDNGTESGHVRVYQNVNNAWIQVGNDIDGEAAQDFSGSSISISADGTILAIGAVFNDGVPNESGHVRVYDLSSVLSVDDILNESKVHIYPNPASTHMNIQIPNQQEVKVIHVYNFLGKRVLESNDTWFDISSLSSGTYLLKIMTNEGFVSKKLIIQ